MAEPKKTTKVIVEALRRQGFPGFYALNRLFPTGTPVEIEVGTEDVYKTRKITDPVTDEVTEDRYLFMESDLKKLKRHSAFLKIYEQGQTPVGGEQPVAANSSKLAEKQKEAIEAADKESRSQGDKGPSGSKR